MKKFKNVLFEKLIEIFALGMVTGIIPMLVYGLLCKELGVQVMSENELKELKEQLKKEILAEMNTKKENENNWKRIKQEYEDEFEKFDYINHWECINCNNKLITRDKEVKAAYPMQSAIGTLLKIIYKAESVAKINAKYEDMKSIVEGILTVCKEAKDVSKNV